MSILTPNAAFTTAPAGSMTNPDDSDSNLFSYFERLASMGFRYMELSQQPAGSTGASRTTRGTTGPQTSGPGGAKGRAKRKAEKSAASSSAFADVLSIPGLLIAVGGSLAAHAFGLGWLAAAALGIVLSLGYFMLTG